MRALAHAYNLMVAPHAFSSAILLVAAMHLLASIPNGLVLEFDQNPHALREDLLQEPIRIDADGFVHLSNQGWVSHSIKRRWNSIVCKVVITVRRRYAHDCWYSGPGQRWLSHGNGSVGSRATGGL